MAEVSHPQQSTAFFVSSLCAATIAAPFSIASITRDETAILRDLFWPHQLNPLITFGAFFVSLLPMFLGYYHLGRLGAFLSLAVSAATWFTMFTAAFLAFAGGHAVIFEIIAYLTACSLLYVVMFAVHMKASNSRAIQGAQRALRLLGHAQMQ